MWIYTPLLFQLVDGGNLLHKTWERTLQFHGQVCDVAWVFLVRKNVRIEFLLEDHERIREFVFFHPQGRQTL